MPDLIKQICCPAFLCISRTSPTVCDQEPYCCLYGLFRKDFSEFRLCPVVRKILVCSDLHRIAVGQTGICKADPGIIFSVRETGCAETLLAHRLSFPIPDQDLVV